MKIVEMEPHLLKPYPNNPRNNDEAVEAVANSIQAFGFKVPIIVDKDNTIIAGHTRWKAAGMLGLETVPVIKADDLTEEQVKAFRLADNKVGEAATWDFDKLAAELEELDGFDMEQFGFDVSGIDSEEPTDIQEDEVPEDAPTRTKPGQIWKLGEHRMMVGDSTKPEDVKRLLDGAEIDLLLTDPPYNVSVGDCERPNSSHDGEHILNDDMPEEEFINFLSKAFKNADEHMKPGAAFYIFYAGLVHTAFDLAIRNIKEWKISEQLVYIKDHFVMGRNSDYQWMHEPIFYGFKSGAAHYFTDSRAEATVIEDEGQKLSTLKKSELIELCEKLLHQDEASTVIRAEKINSAFLHPTVKPQSLLTYLIKNSSRSGENILDLFGGAGSTLIACEQLNRRCFMMELDPKYADVILQRWETFTGEEATLIEG